MDENDELPEWMIPLDRDVLEVLQTDEAFAPSDVADADICRGPQAAHRCRQLADHGLLEKHATGIYDVTDLGERFLEGEVDPATLAADAEADETSE